MDPSPKQIQLLLSNAQEDHGDEIETAGEWTNSLWGCSRDIRTCCLATWCPCIQFGRLSRLLEASRDDGNSGAATCLYCAAFVLTPLTLCFCPLSALLGAGARWQVRSELGIPGGSPASDCLLHCFCKFLVSRNVAVIKTRVLLTFSLTHQRRCTYIGYPCAMTQEYREIRLKKAQIVTTGISATDLQPPSAASGSLVKNVEPGPGPKPMSSAILAPEAGIDESKQMAKKETQDRTSPEHIQDSVP